MRLALVSDIHGNLPALEAVAADIRDNRTMTEAEKDTVARQMRAAPFFADAPRSDVIGNRQRAADTMELAFLMVLVMDSDYIEEHTDWQRGARDGTSTRRLGGVSLPTSDPRYGVTPAMRSSSGLGYSSNTVTYVAYDKPGSRILDRINTLYGQRIGGVDDREDRREDRGKTQPPVNQQNAAVG